MTMTASEAILNCEDRIENGDLEVTNCARAAFVKYCWLFARFARRNGGAVHCHPPPPVLFLSRSILSFVADPFQLVTRTAN